ncbi:hypothetical protein B0A49_12761, partial [Cryomyces minteri]
MIWPCSILPIAAAFLLALPVNALPQYGIHGDSYVVTASTTSLSKSTVDEGLSSLVPTGEPEAFGSVDDRPLSRKVMLARRQEQASKSTSDSMVTITRSSTVTVTPTSQPSASSTFASAANSSAPASTSSPISAPTTAPEFLRGVNIRAKLKTHWESYFNESDVQKIASWGINALRIPIGYWAYDNAGTPY